MARRGRRHVLRRAALGLVVARVVLGVVAVPLAPLLYRRHFLVLILLRPTKDVLLAAGFVLRNGDVSPAEVVAAAAPLLLAGVWLFYYLGRQYAAELRANELPGLGGRMLPPRRVRQLSTVLRERGLRLVFLGRLAAFPSTLVAAAAGSSRLNARGFLAVDGAGGLLSLAEFVGAGYLLGDAYRRAGPWLTGIGIGVLGAAAVLFGRYLRRTG
ncbi:MAG: DedA family protein [Mycobacteriales bacterium]|nr:VTT domain-containing protein [Frankia sp.]